MEQSELELIKAAQDDPAAFRPLYEKYFKKIFLFILYRLGDKESAADVTSQVFLKALLKISDFVFKGSPLSSWLYRIAINECNEFFRKTRQQKIVILDHQVVEHLGQEMNYKIDEIAHDELRLRETIHSLKSREIQLIHLRFFDELSFKEIGEVLDITENNAKVRLYRLLDKMRIKLDIK